MRKFTCNTARLKADCQAIDIGRTNTINGFIVRRLATRCWTVVSPWDLEDAWSMDLDAIVTYILSGETAD